MFWTEFKSPVIFHCVSFYLFVIWSISVSHLICVLHAVWPEELCLRRFPVLATAKQYRVFWSIFIPLTQWYIFIFHNNNDNKSYAAAVVAPEARLLTKSQASSRLLLYAGVKDLLSNRFLFRRFTNHSDKLQSGSNILNIHWF